MEEARYSLFRRRPAFGIALGAIGIGIPALTLLVLSLVAPDFFFSSLFGRVSLMFGVAVSIVIGVVVTERMRKKAISDEEQRLSD